MPNNNPIQISVVIPVYRAEGCLKGLYQRLITSLRQFDGRYELVFIDDRSPDGSWDVLQELAAANPNVRAARLSRNFGQHAAITAGLKLARGKWALLMDCDGQDPPEEIPRLYEKAQEGYDIVLARRIRRTSLVRQFLSRTYFAVLNTFADTAVDGSVGSFSLISRKVVDALLSLPETNRHYMLLLYWLGFHRAFVDYEHADRLAGKSSYSLQKLIKHAFQGMFFQTTMLLEAIVLLGFLVSLAGFGMAVWAITGYLIHSALPGWTSLFVALLMIGGFNLTAVGIVGLYVGQIFSQVKGRPLFIFDECRQSLASEAPVQLSQANGQFLAIPDSIPSELTST